MRLEKNIMFNKNRIQMKKLSYLLASIVLTVILWGGNLSAQDEGTYIDNASPQDSSYTEGDALNFDEYYEEDDKSEIPTAVYIGAGIVVIGFVIGIVLTKKKKKK